MKKILFLQTKLIIDGPGIVVRNIINHLDRSMFEPVVGCMYHAGELEEWYRSAGIKTVNFRMKGPLNGWLDLLAVKRIREFIRKEGIDIVHTNLVRADIYGRIAAYRCGIPVITTVHNTEEHHTSKGMFESAIRHIDRKTIGLCDTVVTVSEAVKRLLCNLYKLPSSKVVVIHNGIAHRNPDDIASIDRKGFGISDDDLIVCMVARLHRQKGVSDFINAIDMINKNGYKVTGIVVGDGPLMDETSMLINKLNAKVTLAGFHRDVFPFIKAADIFVLSSLWEGFGLSIIEAMSLAKPVVATSVGGIPEIVENGVTGILSPPGDAVRLAEGIITLINRPDLRRKMGDAGKERVGRLFTSEVMSREYQGIYSKVLSNNAR